MRSKAIRKGAQLVTQFEIPADGLALNKDTGAELSALYNFKFCRKVSKAWLTIGVLSQ